jgi:hypothetical protein
VADCCEDGNETSGSIEGGEFLDLLIDCWVLKKDTVPMERVSELVSE